MSAGHQNMEQIMPEIGDQVFMSHILFIGLVFTEIIILRIITTSWGFQQWLSYQVHIEKIYCHFATGIAQGSSLTGQVVCWVLWFEQKLYFIIINKKIDFLFDLNNWEIRIPYKFNLKNLKTVFCVCRFLAYISQTFPPTHSSVSSSPSPALIVVAS